MTREPRESLVAAEGNVQLALVVSRLCQDEIAVYFSCVRMCSRTSLKKENPTVPDPLTLSVREQLW